MNMPRVQKSMRDVSPSSIVSGVMVNVDGADSAVTAGGPDG